MSTLFTERVQTACVCAVPLPMHDIFKMINSSFRRITAILLPLPLFVQSGFSLSVERAAAAAAAKWCWFYFHRSFLSPITNCIRDAYSETVWRSFACEIDHKFVCYLITIVLHKIRSPMAAWIPCLMLVIHWIFTRLSIGYGLIFSSICSSAAATASRAVCFSSDFSSLRTASIGLENRIFLCVYSHTKTDTNCFPSIIHRAHKLCAERARANTHTTQRMYAIYDAKRK